MFGKLFNLVIIAGFLAGAAFWYAPIRTVQGLTQALENENAQKVDEYVDFDAVKKSLNDDFAKKMNIDTGKENTSFGASLATQIAGAFVSAIVSPDTMVTVLKDKDRRDHMGLSSDFFNVMARGSWQSADKFVLSNDEDHPTLLLQRTGLTWTVTGMRIN